MGLLDAIKDKQFRSDIGDNLGSLMQGMSNSAASNISAPVDGIAWLMRKAGFPIPSNPFGGSDYLAQQGLTQEPKNHIMGLIGDGLGGAAPIAAAAKATQIAKGLLQMGENAATPSTLNKQAGMALFDTSNLPNRGKDLIQSKAEDLAAMLSGNGFKVELQHSGSAAGPSSYLKVFDPETGRYFDDVRLSGHSKGIFNSQGVTNVASDAELNGVLEKAIGMRALGKSSGLSFQESLDNAAQKLIGEGVKPKTAYNQARSILERNGHPLK